MPFEVAMEFFNPCEWAFFFSVSSLELEILKKNNLPSGKLTVS
jgi:hypothetical protein